MKNKILMLVGLGLILVAILTAMINFYKEEKANLSSNNILEQVESEIPYVEKGEKEITPSTSAINEMPTIELGSNSIVGILEIPTQGLKVPILSELSNNLLQIAPCRYTGSVYLDNMILAGHNYQSHFGLLYNITIGEKVIFTTINQDVFFFEVIQIEYIDGNDVTGMLSGDWDLTLFTCTTNGLNRLTLRCKKVE